ncbi:Gfo/Idh/MocA family oxidoreductase [Actinoplanes sichuanensis]|uniref:Gfo/Idh/MocA family protein n=1 Tax=Actinoplanes sichuanensis TaxID=512349 RepID=A0ABW4A401_9ACTN|nr:Gfo/Idh/MocA family oxidoreductase [Actinoplanes sichuanensis]BEL05862.1 Gfo/Idh/MocA family oxidoreductase [Actinoplanes sichuanensis]
MSALRAAGVTVCAVADVDAGRARAFAADHGVPYAHGDVAGLFGHGLDLVTVCTPAAAHEAGVRAAARYGVPVLCEKPLALDVAQARRMIEVAEAAGIRFGVVFQRRFWPAVDQVRAAVGTPVTGGITARLNRDAAYYRKPGRGRRASEGGGVLMTQVIHHIDLLCRLMGPAAWVSGRCATLVPRSGIDVEDTAAAVLGFGSGAIATLHAGTTFRPGLGVQLWVSDAAGRTAGINEYPEGTGCTDLWIRPGPADRPLSEIHEHLEPYHAAQVADFVAAVRDGRDPAVTGRDALASLEIVEAVYASSRTGRPVELR